LEADVVPKRLDGGRETWLYPLRMKISLDHVSILKMDDKYRFIGVTGGLHSSLGVYGSVKEGVCNILERGRAKILFLTDLERLWRKGVELQWNEEELFNVFSR